jgi:outer membrane murein-binding lipoprotein Lpp
MKKILKNITTHWSIYAAIAALLVAGVAWYVKVDNATSELPAQIDRVERELSAMRVQLSELQGKHEARLVGIEARQQAADDKIESLDKNLDTRLVRIEATLQMLNQNMINVAHSMGVSPIVSSPQRKK